jgi:hypothetical protein
MQRLCADRLHVPPPRHPSHTPNRPHYHYLLQLLYSAQLEAARECIAMGASAKHQHPSIELRHIQLVRVRVRCLHTGVRSL